jgi:DNA mismatch repair protein MLH1
VVPNVFEKMVGKSETPVRDPEHKLVRTDSKIRTLDIFLSQKASPSPALPSDVIELSMPPEKVSCDIGSSEIVDVQLTSVLELRAEVETKEHSGITAIMHEHTFVGLVDTKLALIQHRTKLMMVDYHKVR